MPPKSPDFYDPNAAEPAPKNKGGRPRKIIPPVDMRATAAGQPNAVPAESLLRSPSRLPPSAVDVDDAQPGLTADAGLAAGMTEAEILRADIERIRATRKPFGAFSQKLAYPVRPGYYRHWFNDEPGRVDEAKSNGWAHVVKEGKPVQRCVGRGRDNGAMYGYLLELPKIFWDEDQQSKFDAAQARIDEIKKNPIQVKPGMAQKSDADKFYSPKEQVLTVSETVVRSRPQA